MRAPRTSYEGDAVFTEVVFIEPFAHFFVVAFLLISASVFVPVLSGGFA